MYNGKFIKKKDKRKMRYKYFEIYLKFKKELNEKKN